MPGGGAEIFADRVRALIAPGKEHPDEWFDVHDTAHRLGITTQCTMLYGHVETYEERVDHLLRLRDQQDKTGGFLSFIPLAFHPENTVFERRGFRFTTGADDLKVIAVSRLLLDNVPHVKAYWIMMGLPLAQVALHFGADDVQGTVVREKIFQAAGASARHRAEGRGARPLRPRGGPHPGAARQPLQRDPAMVNLAEDRARARRRLVGVAPGQLCRSAEQVEARLRRRSAEQRPLVLAGGARRARRRRAVRSACRPAARKIPELHQIAIVHDNLVQEIRDYPNRAAAQAAFEALW